jgi:hypothetical protein
MKVNYPTNNKNTQMDFSDNFHIIKNFVQVDHFENILENRSIFSFHRSKKYTDGLKFFSTDKKVCVFMPDYCVKISAKSNYHALHNLNSNPTANFSESDNKSIES